MSKTGQQVSTLIWRKSSHSVGNGQCVEAAAVPATVIVRDTVSPAGGHLQFSAAAWQEFIAQVKAA